MSNVRNWASSFIVAALVLLAPIIGFAVVVAAEMLTDLVIEGGRAPRFGPSPLALWGGFRCASTAGLRRYISVGVGRSLTELAHPGAGTVLRVEAARRMT